jgi:hypothetical protein
MPPQKALHLVGVFGALLALRRAKARARARAATAGRVVIAFAGTATTHALNLLLSARLLPRCRPAARPAPARVQPCAATDAFSLDAAAAVSFPARRRPLPASVSQRPEVPSHFCCSVTGDVFQDPVVVVSTGAHTARARRQRGAPRHCARCEGFGRHALTRASRENAR